MNRDLIDQPPGRHIQQRWLNFHCTRPFNARGYKQRVAENEIPKHDQKTDLVLLTTIESTRGHTTVPEDGRVPSRVTDIRVRTDKDSAEVFAVCFDVDEAPREPIRIRCRPALRGGNGIEVPVRTKLQRANRKVVPQHAHREEARERRKQYGDGLG